MCVCYPHIGTVLLSRLLCIHHTCGVLEVGVSFVRNFMCCDLMVGEVMVGNHRRELLWGVMVGSDGGGVMMGN